MLAVNLFLGEDLVFKEMSLICLLAVIGYFPLLAHAQLVIHAMTGTATKVTSSSLAISTVDGSEHTFRIPTDKNVIGTLSSDLRKNAIVSDAFTKIGDQIVAFYSGFGGNEEAIGLKDYGKGPFNKAIGAFVHYDKHAHVLTVKPANGPNQNYSLDTDVAAETSFGVMEAGKAELHKGEQIRVTASTSQDGKQAVLFVREL